VYPQVFWRDSVLKGLRSFVTHGSAVALGVLSLTVALLASSAVAQEKLCPCPPPAPPPPAWTGALGGGLSLTGGNSDTKSYNLDFALKHDPGKKGVFKVDGFYLRADADGEATVDRTGLGARYEYALGGGGRFYSFGEVRFLRDAFKDVEHLVTPTIGLGYRLVNRDNLKLAVDGGVGLAFEKLTGLDGTTSGAVSAGESFSWKISKSAAFVHAARALWKMKEFGDDYYHLEAGVLASLTTRLDLKLSFVDEYKTKPPEGKKKNDTAVLATVVFKI
jgi:putative salt-induced outer membrane protein